MEQFYSQSDVESMLDYLDDAVANDELVVAESIMNSLKRLSVKVQEGKVDMEACTLTHMMDGIIFYHGLLNVRDKSPVDLELENNKLERDNEILHAKLAKSLREAAKNTTYWKNEYEIADLASKRFEHALNIANQGLENILNS